MFMYMFDDFSNVDQFNLSNKRYFSRFKIILDFLERICY